MKRFIFILLLTVVYTSFTFAQTASDLSIEQALQQITAAYSAESANHDVSVRTAAWKTFIAVWTENYEENINKENKAKISGFLNKLMSERLGLRVTAINTDIPMLVNFLKTFSKDEAVHILYLWIQANTNPHKVNGIYAPPETFMKKRSGDCTEVAWLAEVIFKELDIETTVFVTQYRFDYSLKNHIGAHAFTGLEFTENGKTCRYIIDNRKLYELPLDINWKYIIWQTYSQESEVWRYRNVNTSLWRNVKRDYDDPQMMIRDAFIIFALIPKDTALKEFAGYDLSLYFDDPAQRELIAAPETLFFRDDFRGTINAQKQAGEITDTEYTRLLNIWRKYENDGLKKKRIIISNKAFILQPLLRSLPFRYCERVCQHFRDRNSKVIFYAYPVNRHTAAF